MNGQLNLCSWFLVRVYMCGSCTQQLQCPGIQMRVVCFEAIPVDPSYHQKGTRDSRPMVFSLWNHWLPAIVVTGCPAYADCRLTALRLQGRRKHTQMIQKLEMLSKVLKKHGSCYIVFAWFAVAGAKFVADQDVKKRP